MLARRAFGGAATVKAKVSAEICNTTGVAGAATELDFLEVCNKPGGAGAAAEMDPMEVCNKPCAVAISGGW